MNIISTSTPSYTRPRIASIVLSSTCVILSCLVIAGCGAGGGSVGVIGHGAGDQSSGPAEGRSLGSRGVPGESMTVVRIGSLSPGSECTFRADFTPDAGGAGPLVVEAAVGKDRPGTWVRGNAIAGSASSWSWSVAMPSDLTGSRIWMRITDARGNVSESGGEDFALGY